MDLHPYIVLNFLILLNVKLRLTLEFPTISLSSVSPFTLVLPSRANYWDYWKFKWESKSHIG